MHIVTTVIQSMRISMNNLALLQLLRLSSPALPIGGYAYSQGLEAVCDNSIIHDEETLYQWVKDCLEQAMCYLDVPIFSRCYDAHQQHDVEAVDYWNDYLLASRETKELLLEDTQMGASLARLLESLQLPVASIDKKNCALVTLFSLASVHWQIDKKMAAQALLWAWCENQVSIGIKLIPLGQTSGQIILSRLMPAIDRGVALGLSLSADAIGASCPGMVMASMQHENQYSRLFRS